MIVCKFGGTSVGAVENAKKIKEIIYGNNNRKIIVVSALGKSEKYNYKITDKLFELNILVENGENYSFLLDEIFERYESLSNELGVFINWEKYRLELIENITSGCGLEYIVSRGEYYSALIYSKYLNAEFLDAGDYIKFKKDGKINEKTTKKCLKRLNFNKKYVIGGYYGSYLDGRVCVFSRGGSDITGAIICKLLGFDVYENYTDVEGVFNRNPNVFPNAKSLPVLDMNLAIKMADSGNEVVHRDALKVMKESKSLLLVKSTAHNKKLGTIIVENDVENDTLFICKNSGIVLIYKKPPKNFRSIKSQIGDYDKTIFYEKYLTIFKCIYCDDNLIKSYFNDCKILNCSIITLFEKTKINKTNLKIIKKMAKKLKKCVIFAKFLSINNNFTLIFNREYEGEVINIINRYLQTF